MSTTIPASGPVSFNDIQNAYGGSNPIGLNEYYRNGGIVLSTDHAPNVPTSGAITQDECYPRNRTYRRAGA
mgnify:CR=1 FL=1